MLLINPYRAGEEVVRMIARKLLSFQEMNHEKLLGTDKKRTPNFRVLKIIPR